MDIALSIIVPSYNGEKTLKRAMDSLMKQTLTNIEVIIINDGSKDQTQSIADAYAAADQRVRVIHKPVNEGLSAGRNTGMASANGAYITFLDCDDWVEPDMYERMLRDARDADVIVTGAYHDVLDADDKTAISTPDAIGQSAYVDEKSTIIAWATKLDAKRLFAYTWNKLYKRGFLQECGEIFEQQTLIEDYLFNCKIWDRIRSLTLVDGCYYHYIKQSNEALTQRYLPDYFEIMDKRYVLMRTLLARNGLFASEERRTICNMHIKHIIAGMAKNCSKKAAMEDRQQRVVIARLLKDPNCREAIGYAKGTRKQELVCNAVFASGSVTLNHLFAKLLHGMQNGKGHLFDKLK